MLRAGLAAPESVLIRRHMQAVLFQVTFPAEIRVSQSGTGVLSLELRLITLGNPHSEGHDTLQCETTH